MLFLLIGLISSLENYREIDSQLRGIYTKVKVGNQNSLYLKDDFENLKKNVPTNKNIKFFVEDFNTNNKYLPFPNPKNNLTCCLSSEIELTIRFFTAEKVNRIILDSSIEGSTEGTIEVTLKDENLNKGKPKKASINKEKTIVEFTPNGYSVGVIVSFSSAQSRKQEFCFGPLSIM